MKVILENDLLVVYLSKFYLNNLDFQDKEIVQIFIKDLFMKLNNNYSINFKGYYDIKIYLDKNYGSIIEIKKEELEYLEYFNNQLEINTNVICDSFLYEMEDINYKHQMYILNDKMYLKINDNISDLEMAKIIEQSNSIIYGSLKKIIMKKAKNVR